MNKHIHLLTYLWHKDDCVTNPLWNMSIHPINLSISTHDSNLTQYSNSQVLTIRQTAVQWLRESIRLLLPSVSYAGVDKCLWLILCPIWMALCAVRCCKPIYTSRTMTDACKEVAQSSGLFICNTMKQDANLRMRPPESFMWFVACCWLQGTDWSPSTNPHETSLMFLSYIVS